MLFRSLFIVCALPSLIALLPGRASATPPPRERVLELLNAYEGNASASVWTSLGAETESVLVSVYADRSLMPYVRIRAVSAIANFPTETTREFLRRVASELGQGELFVREAVVALAHAFGNNAESDVTAFLSHNSAAVRTATARALATMQSASATEALRARMRVETDVSVRQAITRALSR